MRWAQNHFRFLRCQGLVFHSQAMLKPSCSRWHGTVTCTATLQVWPVQIILLTTAARSPKKWFPVGGANLVKNRWFCYSKDGRSLRQESEKVRRLRVRIWAKSSLIYSHKLLAEFLVAGITKSWITRCTREICYWMIKEPKVGSKNLA